MKELFYFYISNWPLVLGTIIGWELGKWVTSNTRAELRKVCRKK